MPTAATVPAVTNRFFLTDERRDTNSPDIRGRNGTVHKRFIRAAAVETTLPAISSRLLPASSCWPLNTALDAAFLAINVPV